MGCYFLLQGIFPTQGLNLGLRHCSQMLYPLSHQGSWASDYTRPSLYFLMTEMGNNATNCTGTCSAPLIVGTAAERFAFFFFAQSCRTL